MIKKFKLNKYGMTKVQTTIRQVLAVQMQNDDLVVWIDTEAHTECTWTFHVVYTGERAPNARFLGTVQDKALVYHVFIA